MTETLTISPDEQGVVRVFDVDLEGDAAEAFATDPDAPARALGLSGLNARYVDVFPVSRLAGLSLTDYLIEGHGIPPETLDEYAQDLNGLRGHVAVISSAAFGDGARRLEVGPPLRHVATLAEDRPELHFGDLPSESAKREPAPARAAAPARDGGRPHKPRRAVAAVILVVFVLAIVLFGALS